MKTNIEATKDQTPKTPNADKSEPKAAKAKKAASAPVIDPPAAQPEAKPTKPTKAGKPAKVAKADADGEATDRLPTTLAELKETKGGFVAHLFLTGKDKDAIAKDLALPLAAASTVICADSRSRISPIRR